MKKRKQKKPEQTPTYLLLLGWVRERTTTTHDESGKVIKTTRVRFKLSYAQILYKLFLELMIIFTTVILLSNIYTAYTLSYAYFRPGSFIIGMMFWFWFTWLHSEFNKEIEHHLAHPDA